MSGLKNIRAVSYARFSSNNQREESIDAQQRAIYKYMAEKGYSPIGDYTDEALTGTNTDRPGFQKMIEDAKKGLFDVVMDNPLISEEIYELMSKWICEWMFNKSNSQNIMSLE